MCINETLYFCGNIRIVRKSEGKKETPFFFPDKGISQDFPSPESVLQCGKATFATPEIKNDLTGRQVALPMQILFDIADATINFVIYFQVSETLWYKTASRVPCINLADMALLTFGKSRGRAKLRPHNFTPSGARQNINRDGVIGPGRGNFRCVFWLDLWPE